ncbi:putative phosphoglycerate mutase family protein [Calycina marina]|uniref:Phosphoglycerate mutase family protein n=1 Tax=Calycina marina TaxID=1763456 RepID=A0A9P7YYL9_9HELO|nr:putative phosphoglycerate mutase family protein [Calycina marina]
MLFQPVAVCLLVSVASAQTVYIIRHGEKPDDDDVTGLSAAGVQRSKCLRTVFGASSGYNIGYILAQTPKSSGKRNRPYLTVEPVSKDLGLTVDTSCDRDDFDCVVDTVAVYGAKASGQNILICWEHNALTAIVSNLGTKNAPYYPDDLFNIIWTDPKPYSTITATTSENCPGLDDWEYKGH